MKTIKIADAPNRAIDWLVAKVEGLTYEYRYTTGGDYNGHTVTRTRNYTTDPAQAWPIIEREMLGVFPSESVSGKWCCRPREKDYPSFPITYADTSLVAAMRCFCAFRYGEYAEVPEELLL